jgi:hypothetical protein
MNPRASVYRDSALWSVLEEILQELMATGEITINTAPDYVVAYLCGELAAKKVVSEAGLGVGREATDQ